VSTGSTVCVTENKGEIFLTGTVGSTTDLGTVESAVQPLVGPGRLLDQLTIASMNPGSQIAPSAPVANTGPTQPTQQSEVEQALHSIPRLSNVNVQVAADGVHLSGSVDTPQDQQMASDVARQYAPGRPVVDNVTVANRTQPLQR
jgi:osmotically-inducible protein OsmY